MNLGLATRACGGHSGTGPATRLIQMGRCRVHRLSGLLSRAPTRWGRDDQRGQRVGAAGAGVMRAVAREYDWPDYVREYERTELPPGALGRWWRVHIRRSRYPTIRVTSSDGRLRWAGREMVSVVGGSFVVPDAGIEVMFVRDAAGTSLRPTTARRGCEGRGSPGRARRLPAASDSRRPLGELYAALDGLGDRSCLLDSRADAVGPAGPILRREGRLLLKLTERGCRPSTLLAMTHSPLERSTGSFCKPAPWWAERLATISPRVSPGWLSRWLTGLAVDARGGPAWSTVSIDHHALLRGVVQAVDGRWQFRRSQRYFYDVAGIEGLEGPWLSDTIAVLTFAAVCGVATIYSVTTSVAGRIRRRRTRA